MREQRVEESTSIGQIRGLMQQTVQTQSVCIKRIGRKLTSKLTKFLLNFIGNTNVKDAFHQRLN